MDEVLPDDICALLRDRASSLEQLEVLLVLYGDTGRAWTLDEVAAGVLLPPEHLAVALGELVGSGLATTAEGPGDPRAWRYAAQDAATHETIARLAAIYPRRRLEFIRLLSSLALARIRGSAARAFADAFVIRRKKDG